MKQAHVSQPGWRIVSLGDVCEKITQGPNPKYDGQTSERFRVLKTKDIYDDKISYGTADPIGESVFEGNAKSELLPGDLLLAIVGRGSINKCNVFEGLPGARFIFTRALGLLRPKLDLIAPHFLKFFLQSDVGKSLVDAGIGGASGQEVVTTTYLKGLHIALPPLEEQRRIVAALDEAFAAITTATANAERNLANARDVIRAEVQCQFQSLRDGWRDYLLPEISSNWDSRRKPVTKSHRVPGNVPYYGASGQVDSVRDHLFDDDLLLISEDGANLLMRTYPIAFPISGKSWVNNHAHVLKFHDAATQRLVEYYLNSISLQPWVSGMAQPKLNQKALNEIPIALPPAPLRKELALRLDAIAECCEALAEGYEQRLGELARLKRSLLHRALSGELPTREPLAA